MTDWNHSVIFIVPISEQENAKRISRALNPDSGGYEAFASLASPAGTAPATHCIYDTPVRESFFQTIRSITDSNASVATRAASLKAMVDADYAARWPNETPPSLADITVFLTVLQTFFDTSWDEALAQAGLILISQ